MAGFANNFEARVSSRWADASPSPSRRSGHNEAKGKGTIGLSGRLRVSDDTILPNDLDLNADSKPGSRGSGDVRVAKPTDA